LAKPKSRQAKRKGGLSAISTNEFLPACCPAKRDWGWEAFPQPSPFAKGWGQNRKIFVSLIEKNFCARAIKIMFRKFSVSLSGQAGGNAGRDYSKPASGFCSKKVRISSKRQGA
jgi:hypothetical protein